MKWFKDNYIPLMACILAISSVATLFYLLHIIFNNIAPIIVKIENLVNAYK